MRCSRMMTIGRKISAQDSDQNLLNSSKHPISFQCQQSVNLSQWSTKSLPFSKLNSTHVIKLSKVSSMCGTWDTWPPPKKKKKQANQNHNGSIKVNFKSMVPLWEQSRAGVPTLGNLANLTESAKGERKSVCPLGCWRVRGICFHSTQADRVSCTM